MIMNLLDLAQVSIHFHLLLIFYHMYGKIVWCYIQVYKCSRGCIWQIIFPWSPGTKIGRVQLFITISLRSTLQYMILVVTMEIRYIFQI